MAGLDCCEQPIPWPRAPVPMFHTSLQYMPSRRRLPPPFRRAVDKLRPQLEQLDVLDAAMDQLLSLANELAGQTREMEAAAAAVVAPER